jgi:hypothetical protein
MGYKRGSFTGLRFSYLCIGLVITFIISFFSGYGYSIQGAKKERRESKVELGNLKVPIISPSPDNNIFTMSPEVTFFPSSPTKSPNIKKGRKSKREYPKVLPTEIGFTEIERRYVEIRDGIYVIEDLMLEGNFLWK